VSAGAAHGRGCRGGPARRTQAQRLTRTVTVCLAWHTQRAGPAKSVTVIAASESGRRWHCGSPAWPQTGLTRTATVTVTMTVTSHRDSPDGHRDESPGRPGARDHWHTSGIRDCRQQASSPQATNLVIAMMSTVTVA
jgi:hypothetical protein